MSTLTQRMPASVTAIAQCNVEPLMGGVSIIGLAQLVNPDHPANEMVDTECSQRCGRRFMCRKFFAPLTACDECRAKHAKDDALERAKVYWESICPAAFRDTDKNHKDFPKSQYEATRDYKGKESLLLFGESRKGKTRLGMLLLKRCLVRYGLHVNVLWPERLKSVRSTRDVLEMVERWGRYDVLLMDDSLLSGATDERVTDFLRDLIDYRMRFNRHHIMTSQIGSDDYLQHSDKFKNSTKADSERIKALLNRVRETSRVVSFAETKPKENESNF